MNGRIILGVLLVIVLVAGAVGLGVSAYNMGLAQGMAVSGADKAPAAGVAPYPYPFFGGPFWFRPFGWGFGFLGLLFPLFFFFLIFALLRGIFWGGHRGWRRGPWMDQQTVPPAVEEWHRKMHEPKG